MISNSRDNTNKIFPLETQYATPKATSFTSFFMYPFSYIHLHMQANIHLHLSSSKSAKYLSGRIHGAYNIQIKCTQYTY